MPLPVFRPSRRTVSVALFMALLVPVKSGLAAGDAGEFITDTGKEVLLVLSQNLSPAELHLRLRKLADSDFDVPRIARFVLGSYWRAASEAERQQFTAAFADYMVSAYAGHFDAFRGSIIKVTALRRQGDSTLVTTQILRQDGEPRATVVWSVAETAGSRKITDVSIEGVSQALTYREEFASVMARYGGQLGPLIDDLRQRIPG